MRTDYTLHPLLSYLASKTKGDDTTVAMSPPVSPPSVRDSVRTSVNDFCALKRWQGPPELLYAAFNTRLHGLFLAAAQAEMEGVEHEEIRAMFASLSEILCVGHNMRSVHAPETEIVHV